MKRSTLLIGVSLVTFCVAGCGSSRTSSEKLEPAVERTPQTNSAQSAVNLPPVDCPPEKIVKLFLGALREGSDGLAEGLLTTTAREETAKHDLTVQPPGVPSATFKIGKIDFIDEQHLGAHVHSMWTEEMPDGSNVAYQIVWALRRQPDGWRVAGMATEIVPDEPPVFLNFEDPSDMLEKWRNADRVANERSDTVQQR